jgi:hypothetical protein
VGVVSLLDIIKRNCNTAVVQHRHRNITIILRHGEFQVVHRLQHTSEVARVNSAIGKVLKPIEGRHHQRDFLLRKETSVAHHLLDRLTTLFNAHENALDMIGFQTIILSISLSWRYFA